MISSGPFKIPFICDAFVDQYLYAGEDSVGYKCHDDAVYETENGILLCQEHAILFREGSGRLTFVEPWGRERQEEILKFILNRGPDDKTKSEQR